MEPLTGKRASVYTRELEIAKSFAAKLKQLGNFFQAFHPSAGYWLPFHWNGFSHTTHFTYVIDLRCSEAEIWEQMAPNIRTKLRKTERGGMVASECGADAVFDSVSEIFQSQGRKAPFTRDYLNRLNQAAQNVGAGVCLQATTLDGTVHATTFMVWSAARLYYLAGGSNPATKATGAQPFLVWQSIRFAKQRCAIFDFEGSMIESIETFFRAFGAERVGYTQVFRFNPLIRLYLEARGKLA